MNTDTIALATDLTIAWLSNPHTRVDVDAVPAFLASMHEAVGKLGSATTDHGSADSGTDTVEHKPAVSVRKSLADPEFIISMLDGKKYRTLKRHIGTHGLTPEEYRARFGLKDSYPLTASGYSEARREVAKKLGLGRKPKVKAADQEQPSPKVRKGRSIADAKAAAKAHLGGDN